MDGRKKGEVGSWNLSSRRCLDSYHAKDHLNITTSPVHAAAYYGVAKLVALGHHSLSARDYKRSLFPSFLFFLLSSIYPYHNYRLQIHQLPHPSRTFFQYQTQPKVSELHIPIKNASQSRREEAIHWRKGPSRKGAR